MYVQNARERLPADKGATREDVERVVSAEIRNKLDMTTTPGGVADAVTTVEASLDATSSALALARTLLPTVPLPTLEYNLPILEVQRYWPLCFLFFYHDSSRQYLNLISLV